MECGRLCAHQQRFDLRLRQWRRHSGCHALSRFPKSGGSEWRHANGHGERWKWNDECADRCGDERRHREQRGHGCFHEEWRWYAEPDCGGHLHRPDVCEWRRATAQSRECAAGRCEHDGRHEQSAARWEWFGRLGDGRLHAGAGHGRVSGAVDGRRRFCGLQCGSRGESGRCGSHGDMGDRQLCAKRLIFVPRSEFRDAYSGFPEPHRPRVGGAHGGDHECGRGSCGCHHQWRHQRHRWPLEEWRWHTGPDVREQQLHRADESHVEYHNGVQDGGLRPEQLPGPGNGGRADPDEHAVPHGHAGIHGQWRQLGPHLSARHQHSDSQPGWCHHEQWRGRFGAGCACFQCGRGRCHRSSCADAER